MTKCFATILLSCLLLGACGLPSASNIPTPTANISPELRATIVAELDATLAAEQTAREQAATATRADPATPAATARPADAVPSATPPALASTVEATATSEATSAAPQPAATSVLVVEPGAQSQQTVVNVQLVFDASGSMAERIGDETRIAAARRASEQLFATLPTTNINLNVGFRVFGHRGDNTEAGRGESCQSTELLAPMTGVNIELLRQQANAWDPTGWTPISLALQESGEDFPDAENVRNVIIMVTDGEETCAGDPCAVATALAASRAEVRIDLVGFGATPEIAAVLECIPANSGGVYIDAQDGDALQRSLAELIAAALQRSTLTIQTIDPDGPTADVFVEVFDAAGESVALYNELDEAASSAAPFADGRQRVELSPGTYRIEVSGINEANTQPREHSLTIYNARVVEGQNIDVIAGLGTLTISNVDGKLELGGSERFRDIELQKQIEGSWQETLFQQFYPGKPLYVSPGLYRLVYRADGQEQVVAENISVAPGKAVAIDIRAP